MPACGECRTIRQIQRKNKSPGLCRAICFGGSEIELSRIEFRRFGRRRFDAP
jgi:hypothetical protein